MSLGVPVAIDALDRAIAANLRPLDFEFLQLRLMLAPTQTEEERARRQAILTEWLRDGWGLRGTPDFASMIPDDMPTYYQLDTIDRREPFPAARNWVAKLMLERLREIEHAEEDRIR